jgi:hypothetical protein
MADPQAPTNERIAKLLEELKEQLADAKRRDETLAEQIRRLGAA